MDVVLEVLVFLVDFLVLFCVGMKEEVEFDFKYVCNNQGEVNVLFFELDCLFFLEISVSVEEKNIEVLMECKVKINSSLLFKFLVREDEQSDFVLGELNDIIEGKDVGGKFD